MEVINEYGIDIALNVAGYLIAATLGILVFSLFQRRRSAEQSVTESPHIPAPSTADSVSPATTEPESSLQFISLRSSSDVVPERAVSRAQPPASANGSRRDRAEIIRIAREMIKAGAPGETIKRTLPISDGELALLAQAGK